MELNVLLDCEPDRVPLLREVVDGAGLTVRSDGEAPVLVVDLPVLEHVALVDQVEGLWKRLHELVKSVSGACKLVNGQEDRDVRLQNVSMKMTTANANGFLSVAGRTLSCRHSAALNLIEKPN